MISIPNQLVGASIGQDVTLECNSEAYPKSINYWSRDTGEIIVSGNLPFCFAIAPKCFTISFACIQRQKIWLEGQKV